MQSASRLARHQNRMAQRQARVARRGQPVTQPVFRSDVTVAIWSRRLFAPAWRVRLERRV